MPTIYERLDKLIDEVRNDLDHEKRMFSQTFWGDLNIKRRTNQKIELIKDYLVNHGILVNTESSQFGDQPKKSLDNKW